MFACPHEASETTHVIGIARLNHTLTVVEAAAPSQVRLRRVLAIPLFILTAGIDPTSSTAVPKDNSPVTLETGVTSLENATPLSRSPKISEIDAMAVSSLTVAVRLPAQEPVAGNASVRHST